MFMASIMLIGRVDDSAHDGPRGVAHWGPPGMVNFDETYMCAQQMVVVMLTKALPVPHCEGFD